MAWRAVCCVAMRVLWCCVVCDAFAVLCDARCVIGVVCDACAVAVVIYIHRISVERKYWQSKEIF